MVISLEKSNELQRRASAVMPLGVNSNFRYWGEGITPYVKQASGSHLWDVDGNRFIDYRMAFGPIILGHAYEQVDAKVHEQIDQGVLFAMTSELEVAVMEKIVAVCPAVEMARLACSGTEADDACDPCCPRIHRTREGHQVRGHVPRLPGLHTLLDLLRL